ncbi:MAG: hypothetical protein K0V04_32135, partial [Deltaproteobacteria bacterium]|nr:hypothetical protein [Deltaproteobacteria bacterium]
MTSPKLNHIDIRVTAGVRRAAVALLLLGVAACDQGDDDAEPGDGLAEEVVVAAPTRIYQGEGFTLASAQTAPAQRLRTVGPVTLEYIGPHVYVTPEDDLVELVDEDDAAVTAQPQGDSAIDVANVRLIDAQGHEWAMTGIDAAQTDALVQSYQEGVAQMRSVAAHDGHTNFGDVDDLAAPTKPQLLPNWTEFDCGFSTKWRFNNGSNDALDGLNVSQRRPILDTNGTGFSGTAVLVAGNLALTAGHVASALVVGDSMCRRFGTSSTQCRNVDSVVVSGDGGGNDDWGLIKFSASFTGGLVYNLSSESDGQINNHTPRIAAYPTLVRGEEAICGTSALLEGERNLGNYHALLQREARVDLTAGGGSSGAPYYYYDNGDYWIFGIHSGR